MGSRVEELGVLGEWARSMLGVACRVVAGALVTGVGVSECVNGGMKIWVWACVRYESERRCRGGGGYECR